MSPIVKHVFTTTNHHFSFEIDENNQLNVVITHLFSQSVEGQVFDHMPSTQLSWLNWKPNFLSYLDELVQQQILPRSLFSGLISPLAKKIHLNLPQSQEDPQVIFAQAIWEQELGKLEECPPLPAKLIEILKKPCPFWSNKTIAETHSIIWIPEKVNETDLTLVSFVKLIVHSNSSKINSFALLNEEILAYFGGKRAGPARWMLMTRGLVPQSRLKSYPDQHQVAAQISDLTQIPYELPSLLEAGIGYFMESIRSSKRKSDFDLLNGHCRCQEEVCVDGRYWPTAIGPFTASSLKVIIDRYDDAYYDISESGCFLRANFH
ncbi:MAG: hypothetical protein ACHQUC_05430 [Chlamydiales bacterium]